MKLLLNSLYDNLGIVIPKFGVSTAEARARGIPDYELARSRGEKLVKPGKNSKKIIQKAKYGVWYTDPSKWERNYQFQIESIRKSELSVKIYKTRNPYQEKRNLTKKLDEIIAYRAKEEQRLAATLAQLSLKSTVPPPSTGNAAATVDAVSLMNRYPHSKVNLMSRNMINEIGSGAASQINLNVEFVKGKSVSFLGKNG
ncbi:hypothetical protein HK098_006411 [Nowakowskiella sp. JEL0407]|nr:hypothetical protein HK098_006411 [Nowakowskiella sp. JEL0407]